MADRHGPFDSLLCLEDDFYKYGHDLGVADGEKAGLVEGRFFGLEKGFEKYAAMGRMHGKATVWAGRLPLATSEISGTESAVSDGVNVSSDTSVQIDRYDTSQAPGKVSVSPLSANGRLEGHVRTLYALTEPGSLSIENTEDSVSEFDDRLKRAEGKIKVVEKLTGEHGPRDNNEHAPNAKSSGSKGDGSIEDVSTLHARH